MEDKKPADEGQAWAQIGTKTTQSKPATNSNDSATTKPENSTPAEDTNSKQDVEAANDKETEGNGLEIDMDAPMDPIQIDAPESDNTTTDNTTTDKSMSLEERRKKNVIGDGFEDVEVKEKKDPEIEAAKKRDRSRSRSRERGRHSDGSRYSEGSRHSEGRPESTNSSHPKKIRSRVFVGQINMDKCTMEGLRDAFGKYGTLHGINLQNGYAFIQLDGEESALLAIKGLNKTDLFGQEIVVSKPNAWINLDKEESRNESRSQRALMEELDYLRRKDLERGRYERRDNEPRYRGYDKGYERGYDRSYERDYDRGHERYERDRYPAYDVEREDRYGHYGGGVPPPRGSSYYGEERYEGRYRDSHYYGGGGGGGAAAPPPPISRGGGGGGGGAGGGAGGYYMGGGGGGDSYYGGRRM